MISKREKRRKKDHEDANFKGVRVPVKIEFILVRKSTFFIFTSMYKVLEARCEFCGKTFRKSIKLKSMYKFNMSLGEIW